MAGNSHSHCRKPRISVKVLLIADLKTKKKKKRKERKKENMMDKEMRILVK